MTTTVKVEHIAGNKAVQVSVVDHGDTTEKVLINITVLSPEESAEFLLHDSQYILVEETGEFLD